jgi:hypothetical protein
MTTYVEYLVTALQDTGTPNPIIVTVLEKALQLMQQSSTPPANDTIQGVKKLAESIPVGG